MENASKALIIAGAILLAILIIALGMYVYNSASSAMEGTNLDPQRFSAYNSTFLNYEGTISGTEAKSLYDAIRSHNQGNTADVSLQISLTFDNGDFAEGATQDAPTAAVSLPAKSTILNGGTYNVTFATDPNSGYITACNMEKQ